MTGPAVNPKTIAGQVKPPLHLLEYAADVEIAMALADGARKYGRKNYLHSPIPAIVYGGAIRRHVGLWLAGEDVAEDSGIHHLAHVGAGIHIVFAALANGNFVDDRAGDK
jgi:hypothetical protein